MRYVQIIKNKTMDPLYVGGAVFAAGIVARALYSICCANNNEQIKKKKKKKSKNNATKKKSKAKRAKNTDELSSFISSGGKANEGSNTLKKRKNKKKYDDTVPETKQKANNSSSNNNNNNNNKKNNNISISTTEETKKQVDNNNYNTSINNKKKTKKSKKNADAGEWSVVPSDKKKKKKKGGGRKGELSQNLNSETKDYVSINTKQIGILIGPGGKNLQAIQTGANVRINVPRNPQGSTTNVEVEGIGMNVQKAKTAIRDLMDKGYCSYTTGEDFYEDSIMVHPMYFPDIIGKNGLIIRRIQDDIGARLNIPKNTNMNSSQRSRVMITGPKANVRQAKDVVYSIMQFYHHEITHPGVVHAEINVAEWQRQTLVGPKGSTIKHIQGNWSVNVCLPNENSLNGNTLIVGLPKNVDGAKRYILKILSDADEVQASYEQENNLGGDWGAAGTNDDDNNGWGNGW